MKMMQKYGQRKVGSQNSCRENRSFQVQTAANSEENEMNRILFPHLFFSLVRVARFYQNSFSSSSSFPSSSPPCSSPRQSSLPSVSPILFTSAGSQRAPLDLIRQGPIAVCTAGPQPPNRMPKYLPKGMPEYLPDRWPNICQIECQNTCQIESPNIRQIECQID